MSSQTIAARTTATRCVRGYVHATPAADLGAESAFALLCGSSSLYYLIDELSSHEGSEARRDRDLDAALGSRDQGPARLDPLNHRWRRETRCQEISINSTTCARRSLTSIRQMKLLSRPRRVAKSRWLRFVASRISTRAARRARCCALRSRVNRCLQNGRSS